MTPNFPLFRKLYSRISAKPEALVRLDRFASKPVDCGTPFCVLGELISMSDGRELGFAWMLVAPYCGVQFNGQHILSSRDEAAAALGVSLVEWDSLFNARLRPVITEKAEALARIESLFAAHNEPLLIAEPVVIEAVAA